MIKPMLRALFLAAAFCAFAAAPAAAQDSAQTTLHLLDYVGADYPGAVENGKVRSADEFKEMQEFVGQAVERIRKLPDHPARAALAADADRLAKLVNDKADPEAVAETATKLRLALAAAYGLALAPRRLPDPATGKALYAAHCATCHGAEGRGDGPAAKGLDPAPANFLDDARMANRSVYGLYNTITLGVTGTSMAAFGQLSEDERWALAFFAANAGRAADRVKEGEKLWQSGPLRGIFTGLADITSLSASELRKRRGADAALVLEYLRAHPEALTAGKPAPIAYARHTLAQALAAYKRGERAAAREAAVVAYLEGFELVETGLDNVDKPLRLEIEKEMLALRGSIGAGVPADALEAQVARIDKLLEAAEGKLEPGTLSPGAAFASSLLILLREGLEAILLLAAIIAFVKKTGRPEALRYVHAGWLIAFASGLATWAIAAYAVSISGAHRELTEGFTALFASAMLLYVGYWLHGKTQAQAWNAFLRESVGEALEKKTLWALAGISFLAVYREIFEVVLFYEALSLQAGDAGRHAVWAGISAAAALLAAIGWGIFRYSLRLPLGPFFRSMSFLLALLAIVFAGQGVAALQEAGFVSASRIHWFSLPLLGIHPTLETLAAQSLAALLVALGILAPSIRGRLVVRPKV